MGFKDNLKRSLGFEETESSGENTNDASSITERFNDIKDTIMTEVSNFQNSSSKDHQSSQPAPDIEKFFTFCLFEIARQGSLALGHVKFLTNIALKQMTLVDQVIEEKNPVIVDLSFLERESHANFRLAGEKIKKMRTRYGAQALLLARSENKNLIIISPEKVKLVNKN